MKKAKKKASLPGPPSLRQGDGAGILRSVEPEMQVVLPFNSFWLAWEAVEAGLKRAQRYEGGPLAHVPAAWAEAAKEMRIAFYRNTAWGRSVLERMQRDEEEKQKAAAEAARKLNKAQKKGSPSRHGPKASEQATGTKQRTGRKRCREVFEENPDNRCTGPAGHGARHRDRHGHRWVSE